MIVGRPSEQPECRALICREWCAFKHPLVRAQRPTDGEHSFDLGAVVAVGRWGFAAWHATPSDPVPRALPENSRGPVGESRLSQVGSKDRRTSQETHLTPADAVTDQCACETSVS